MKIAILGYSGSGKSTLARAIAKKTGIACLHLDSVHFLPGWVEKADEQARTEVQAFLTAHADWVIDGNYPALCRAERLAAADAILFVALPRVSCLVRVLRRIRIHRGRVRPDMAPGCPEKVDAAFLWWVLCKGRGAAVRRRNREALAPYAGKVVRLSSQRAIDRFLADFPASLPRFTPYFPRPRGKRGIPH